jgi:hypothetical protein
MQRNVVVVVIDLNPRRGREPDATTPVDNIHSGELLDRVLAGRRTKEWPRLAVWPEPGDDSSKTEAGRDVCSRSRSRA